MLHLSPAIVCRQAWPCTAAYALFSSRRIGTRHAYRWLDTCGILNVSLPVLLFVDL